MALFAEIKLYYQADFGLVQSVQEMGDHVPEAALPWLWVAIDGYDPQPDDQVPWYYSQATDSFSQAPPGELTPDPVYIQPFDFWLGRFTDDERAKAWASFSGVDLPGVDWGQGSNRWRAKAWHDLSIRSPIDLVNSETTWVVNALELAGVLDPGRAAEILT